MGDITPLSQTRRVERLDDGPFVTVINRTARNLTVQVDGRQWILKPGRNPNISVIVAERAIKQHPRLGTFDPRFGGGESLVGVEGHTPTAQLTPLPPGKEHRGAEYVDRQAYPLDPKKWETETLPERRRIEERDPLAGETAGAINLTGDFDAV